MVARHQPDVVIIDMESPDRDTLDSMSLLNRENPRPVVFFADQHDPETMQAALKSGVSAYVVDGLVPGRVKAVMEVAIARFESFQSMRRELDQARTQLAERKRIERAKGLLMKHQDCDEPQAYRMLRKLAMDRGQRIGDVANNVIDILEQLEKDDERARTRTTDAGIHPPARRRPADHRPRGRLLRRRRTRSRPLARKCLVDTARQGRLRPARRCHMLSPLPLAMSLGLSRAPCETLAPFILGRGGNTIVLSRHWSEGMNDIGEEHDPRDNARRFAARLHTHRGEPPRLAMVYPYSCQHYQLREWLAGADIDIDRQVTLGALPPPRMVEALENGEIDGFCVGEPGAAWPGIATSGVSSPAAPSYGRRTPRRSWA